MEWEVKDKVRLESSSNMERWEPSRMLTDTRMDIFTESQGRRGSLKKCENWRKLSIYSSVFYSLTVGSPG